MQLRFIVRGLRAAALRVVAAATLASAAVGLAAAAEPRVLLDINDSPLITNDSIPRDFEDQGSWSLFFATDALFGNEPWRTDGSAEGTYLLADILPGDVGATGAPQAVRVGSRSYFNRHGLWVTDGTKAGTRPVSAKGDHPALQAAAPIGALGNDLLFAAAVNGPGQMWRTDGTEFGTRQITSFGAPTSIGVRQDATLILGQQVYFLIQPASDRVEVWRSDGTAAGNTLLGTVQTSGLPSTLVAVGNRVLFLTSSNTGAVLWRIERATGTVEQVAALTLPHAGGAYGTGFTTIGDVAIFTPADQPSTLWRSDGTTAGTFQFPNVMPTQNVPWDISGPLANGRRVFVARDLTNGSDLWTTDGTLNGTTLLDDQGGGGNLYTVGSTALYNKGEVLWRTDGTAAGTRPLNLPSALSVRQVAGDNAAAYLRMVDLSAPLQVAVYRYDLAADTSRLLLAYGGFVEAGEAFAFARGELYFSARSAAEGKELWISDGTVGGTHLLKNLIPETMTAPSRPHGFVEFGDHIYFSAISPSVAGGTVQTSALWRTRGTAATTEKYADISASQGGSDPRDMFVVNNRLVLFAHDTSGVYHLYSADGVRVPGPEVIAHLYAPAIGGVPRTCESRRPVLNGFAYLAAHESTGGLELWRTNGTSAGTTRVADINPGGADATPCGLTAHDGKIFFSANGGAGQGGTELWVSDGTSAGTHRVRNAASAAGSAPKDLVSFGGALYFISTGTAAAQLWKSDGTSAGTVAVADAALLGAGTSVGSLRIANGALLFTTSTAGQPTRLWRSDGSQQGTTRIDSVPLVDSPITTTASRAFFRSQGPDSADDRELWSSDATNAGSALVQNLGQGNPADVSGVVDFFGIGAFQFLNPAAGPQLWRTDGTAARTRLFGALNGPLVESDSVDHLAALQAFLLFAVDDQDLGAEVYVQRNEVPVPTLDTTQLNAGASITLDVLANDRDPDGELVVTSLRIVDAPATGTAAVTAAGRITYTASATFTGQTTFTYSVADDQGFTATAQVRVAIEPVNPPPPPPPPSGGGGGGGGGALGGLSVLALLLLHASRRKYTCANSSRSWR
jgi:ELWxxDGT repeat protein